MRIIKINYTDLEGNEHTEEIQADSSDIRLFLRETKSIDLSPLSECKNLESLILNHSRADTIDFSPLSECKNLKKLYMENNRFRTIDLSFLYGCPKFESLYIENEDLEEVDLTPLSSCPSLENLTLDKTSILTKKYLKCEFILNQYDI